MAAAFQEPSTVEQFVKKSLAIVSTLMCVMVGTDPVFGQVAIQTHLKILGRDALVAVRLKIDRGKVQEIEQLYDRNVNEAAIPLLTTRRPTLVNDVPAEKRRSREYMIWAANSYFDALEGDNGKIAAFAEDCVRHEQGYQTVHNPSTWRTQQAWPGFAGSED